MKQNRVLTATTRTNVSRHSAGHLYDAAFTIAVAKSVFPRTFGWKYSRAQLEAARAAAKQHARLGQVSNWDTATDDVLADAIEQHPELVAAVRTAPRTGSPFGPRPAWH